MQEPMIAYWILLVAGMMPFVIVGIAKSGRGYDNGDPRNPAALDTPLRRAAYGAHLNCLEAFPFFAAAVLLAGLRRAPADIVDIAACVWLASRIVFVGCYLTGRSTPRSLSWIVGNLTCVAIIVLSLLRGGGAV